LLQAGQEHDLSSQDVQGPCLVVYHNEDGITDVFLLCEGKIINQSHVNSAYVIINILMAAYFVLDKSYPPAYGMFLNFIHQKVLNLKPEPRFQGSITYNRFLKEFALAELSL
jgi:hypothetical protein